MFFSQHILDLIFLHFIFHQWIRAVFYISLCQFPYFNVFFLYFCYSYFHTIFIIFHFSILYFIIKSEPHFIPLCRFPYFYVFFSYFYVFFSYFWNSNFIFLPKKKKKSKQKKWVKIMKNCQNGPKWSNWSKIVQNGPNC